MYIVRECGHLLTLDSCLEVCKIKWQRLSLPDSQAEHALPDEERFKQ